MDKALRQYLLVVPPPLCLQPLRHGLSLLYRIHHFLHQTSILLRIFKNGPMSYVNPDSCRTLRKRQ